MKTSSRGLTLVELLVAFIVFIMLISALVTLTTRSLETWHQGETRKEMYDRAQGVLETIARDLRNVYSESEWHTDGVRLLMPPVFACDEDAGRRQRLRFVRTGDPNVIRAPAAGSAATFQLPVMQYGAMWEVAYVLDPEDKPILWRGVREYTRQPTGTLLRPADYPGLFAACFKPVDTGILHVGYRFWTQFTTTWNESTPVQRVAPNSQQMAGPERRWESTRRGDPRFFFNRSQPDVANPDFVYPEIVQVIVVIETSTPDDHGVRLYAACDARQTSLTLTHTRGLPEAPGMVKLGPEWVEYGAKTDTELLQVKRGARGSAAQDHVAQTPVRFGETFTTDVRLAAYREAQQP